MFRALHVFPPNVTGPIRFEAPLSVILANNHNHDGTSRPDVDLAIVPDAIFTTSVGPSTKRTLASWHVTAPIEVVEHMLHLVGEERVGEEVLTGNGSGSGEEVKGYLR